MVCTSINMSLNNRTYTFAATTATKAAAAADFPANVNTNTPTTTSWTAMRADSPYVLNGNRWRTLYERVISKLAVSSAYETNDTPAEDRESINFRICGTLTMALAETMASPRALEIASDTHAGSLVTSRSRT